MQCCKHCQEWSTFLKIKGLVEAGVDTQVAIAEKLGLYVEKGRRAGEPNRHYIQSRVNLSRLPLYVQQEVCKMVFDRASTPIRWSDIAHLYRAYNGEYTTHPDGNGPEMARVWERIMRRDEYDPDYRRKQVIGNKKSESVGL